MTRIFLASQSPRRQELLNLLGLDFIVHGSRISEEGFDLLTEDGLVALAGAKDDDVIRRLGLDSGLVIAADTVVILNGEVIGKPGNRDDAFDILKRLSGTTHEVRTGLVVKDTADQRTLTHVETTRVTFHELGDDDIDWYLETGDYKDKAGAYGIQGIGGLLVDSIEGDYYNVVGLPMARLRRMLRDMDDPDKNSHIVK